MYLTTLASLHRLDPETSLLVNALSGAVDMVDNGVRAEILKLGLGWRPDLEERHGELLMKRGYLFASQAEERAALREVYDAYQRLTASRPLQFVVCPTYACNLSCTYCFESAQLRSRCGVMTLQQVKHLFAALRKLAAVRPRRPCHVVLFGGEPLLPSTEAVVGAILGRAREAGLTVQIVSNGTHLERFASLLSRHRGILRSVQITLDGPQSVHDARRKGVNGRGSFAEVVRGIEVCFQVGVEVNLRVNLDAHNMSSLGDLVQFLEARGWARRNGFRCQLAPVTDHLGTSLYPFIMREDEFVQPLLELWHRCPEFSEVLDCRLFRVLDHLVSVIEPRDRPYTLPRFHYCEADRGDIFAFGPDGLIYVCPESAGTPRHAVGVYSPRYRLWPRRLRRWQKRTVLALPRCQQCSIATFCGGGCAYAALQQFGSTRHGVCGDAPRVVRAYLRALRRQLPSRKSLVPA